MYNVLLNTKILLVEDLAHFHGDLRGRVAYTVFHGVLGV